MTGSRPDALSPAARAEAVQALRTQTLDVLVVGGGVVGAGAALDAAARGLTVGLVEQSDLAAGTSSRSSRLAHGGLRYLEQREFHLVHEALTERGLLLDRLAPHLVRPVPFLFPVSKQWERPYVASGVHLYDLLSRVGAYGGTMPRPKSLNRQEAKDLAPDLDTGEMAGAVRFHDAQIDDARHTVAVARTAMSYGAHIVTRTRVVELLRAGEEDQGGPARVIGARVHDALRDETYDIHARVVVAAAGVWTDDVMRLVDPDSPVRVRQSKGVHIVVPGDAFRSTSAVIARTPVSVLFMLPWAGKWIIGTTDTPWEEGDLADPRATEEDVDYLLEQANRWLARPLTRGDVLATYAGLRPLIAASELGRGDGDGEKGAAEEATTTLSREHAIFRPVPGLVAIAGGKYTTYRVMAADAIDAAVEQLTRDDGEPVPGSTTADVPLVGAVGFRELWKDRSAVAARAGLSLQLTERLLRRHGSRIGDVLDLVVADRSLGEALVEGQPYLRAEAVVAVTHQGALDLADVLVRRLRIATEVDEAERLAAAEVTVPLIAGLLGWDEATARAELATYLGSTADAL